MFDEIGGIFFYNNNKSLQKIVSESAAPKVYLQQNLNILPENIYQNSGFYSQIVVTAKSTCFDIRQNAGEYECHLSLQVATSHEGRQVEIAQGPP